MATPHFFFELPQQLQFEILSEWLGNDLSLLATVDSACCSQVLRPKLHQLMGNVAVQYAPAAGMLPQESVVDMLKWLDARRMRLRSLVIVPEWIGLMMKLASRTHCGPRCLLHTQRLTIKNSDSHCLTVALADLLVEFFPSVIHLRFEGWYADKSENVLAVVNAAAGNLCLSSLDFESCIVEGLPAAISPFAGSIHSLSLNCGNVGEGELTTLISALNKCRNLSDLTLIDLSYEITDSDLLTLLTHNTLRTLHLDGDKFAMEGTEDLVLSLLQQLPQLKRIELGSVSEACPPLACLSDILNARPGLEHFGCPRFIFDKANQSLEVLHEEDALLVCPCPLRRLVCHLRDSNDVDTIVDHFSAQLASLELYVQHSIIDTNAMSLFSHCNRLSELQLWYCKNLSDEVLFSIASHCPSLTNLEIHVAKKFSNDGVRDILQKCGQLYSLKLTQCTQITNELWSWITLWGRNLRVISLLNAQMTALAIVSLLIENKLQLIRLHLPYEFQRTILLGLTPHKKVLAKWKHRLLFATC